jgi:predicted ATPase
MITVLAALAQKSLVVVELTGEAVHFRLLNTMRLYAFDRLSECGEDTAVRRRHAEYHRDLFARARSEWETEPTDLWLAAYRHRIDDLRAVLDWAFSPDGDADLGLALTVDAVPLWLQLSLMQELRQRVETAMKLVMPPATADARLQMRLSTARSLSRMYAGDPISDVNAAWSETLELAEHVGDPDYQLRAMWGLFAGSFNRGDYRDALGFAQQFGEVADRPADKQIGERLIGTALHYLGDQQAARVHIERMLAEYSPPPQSSHIIRYQNDQIVAARRILAPILWLQGFPDQAMRMTEDAVRDAAALGHALTLCNLLAQSACPLALLTGDMAVAQRFVAMLLEQSSRYSFDVWHAYGRGFEAITLITQGEFDRGLALLSDAASDLNGSGFMQYYTQHLAALADGFACAGMIDDGLAAIEKALDRVELTEERWCFPELLRIKGELLLRQEIDAAPTLAEQQFRQSLEWADRQQALSWQLRTATSLARLLRDQDRAEEARQLLSAIYARFSEGFDTHDLIAAKQVLDELG